MWMVSWSDLRLAALSDIQLLMVSCWIFLWIQVGWKFWNFCSKPGPGIVDLVQRLARLSALQRDCRLSLNESKGHLHIEVTFMVTPSPLMCTYASYLYISRLFQM